jgi:ZIP family zinc transporter
MDSSQSDRAILTVLLFAALAAGASVFGAAPLYRRRPASPEVVAFAYALASGLMLGAGYILLTVGLVYSTLQVMLGGGLGVVYTYWTHRYSSARQMDAAPGAGGDPAEGVRFILLGALHSASEGVAIGSAMVVSIRLGAFIAVSLAIHNIAEAITLTDILRKGKASAGEAIGLTLVAKAPQLVLAVVVFALAHHTANYRAPALGFAAGAMVYLVLTELLPHSYERTGRTRIAFLVSTTTGIVVLLSSFFW